MKILMPVDGSVYTRHMLEFVATRNAWLADNNEIVIVTVVPPVPQRMLAFMNHEEAEIYYAAEANAVLKPVQAFTDPLGWKPTIVHKIGSPGRVIPEMATEGGFDLVVMGSHGHSALGSLVLGSVTAKVLARTEVAMLIVRH